MRNLSNEELIEKLTASVKLERKTTAEILELIREVERRRLYLALGHTSLFAYLTKSLGYSAASAQRRIESARLLDKIPSLKTEISDGKLNLMQTSLLAQGLRNVEKPVEPVDIVEKIKGQDLQKTQVILARELDQPIQTFEKKRLQKDESLRLEITLSKEEQKIFEHLRDLISHVHPGLGWKDLFLLAAKDSIAKRDLVAKKPRRAVTSKMEAAVSHQRGNVGDGLGPIDTRMRRARIPTVTKREIYKRDQVCQWRDTRTGEKCGSTFQLQIDHIKSVCFGGGNESENLQLLCAAHNRWKFKLETHRT